MPEHPAADPTQDVAPTTIAATTAPEHAQPALGASPASPAGPIHTHPPTLSVQSSPQHEVEQTLGTAATASEDPELNLNGTCAGRLPTPAAAAAAVLATPHQAAATDGLATAPALLTTPHTSQSAATLLAGATPAAAVETPSTSPRARALASAVTGLALVPGAVTPAAASSQEHGGSDLPVPHGQQPATAGAAGAAAAAGAAGSTVVGSEAVFDPGDVPAAQPQSALAALLLPGAACPAPPVCDRSSPSSSEASPCAAAPPLSPLHATATTSTHPLTEGGPSVVHPSLSPIRTTVQKLLPEVAAGGPIPSLSSMDVDTPHSARGLPDPQADWEHQEQVLQRASEILEARELLKRGTIPPAQEPKRLKAHWDYLLEEMEWLAKEVSTERIWKLKQCKRFAKAVGKSKLNVEFRGEVKEKEHEVAMRKIAAGYSKQVMDFWKKAERLVNYKRYLLVEQRKQAEMERHLSFLVGQTERYSRVLAENLRQDGNKEEQLEAAKEKLALEAPKSDPSLSQFLTPDNTQREDQGVTRLAKRELASSEQEPTSTARPRKRRKTRGNKRAAKAYHALKLEGGTAVDDEEEFHANVDQDEDDEATLSAEEELANKEGGGDHKQELNALDEDANLSIEELLARYYGGGPPADSPPASPTQDGSPDGDEVMSVKSENDDKSGKSEEGDESESGTSDDAEETEGADVEEEENIDEDGETEGEREDGYTEREEPDKTEDEDENERGDAARAVEREEEAGSQMKSKRVGRASNREPSLHGDAGKDKEHRDDEDEVDDCGGASKVAATEAAGVRSNEAEAEAEGLQAVPDNPQTAVKKAADAGEGAVPGGTAELAGSQDKDSGEQVHEDHAGGVQAEVGGRRAVGEGVGGGLKAAAPVDAAGLRDQRAAARGDKQHTLHKESTEAVGEVGVKVKQEAAGCAASLHPGTIAETRGGNGDGPQQVRLAGPDGAPSGVVDSLVPSVQRVPAVPETKPDSDRQAGAADGMNRKAGAEHDAAIELAGDQRAVPQHKQPSAQQGILHGGGGDGGWGATHGAVVGGMEKTLQRPHEALPELGVNLEVEPIAATDDKIVELPHEALAGMDTEIKGEPVAGPSKGNGDDYADLLGNDEDEEDDKEEEFAPASDEEQDDDEATMEEEEAIAAQEGAVGAKDEEDALKADMDVPLEELLARYYRQDAGEEGGRADEDGVREEGSAGGTPHEQGAKGNVPARKKKRASGGRLQGARIKEDETAGEEVKVEDMQRDEEEAGENVGAVEEAPATPGVHTAADVSTRLDFGKGLTPGGNGKEEDVEKTPARSTAAAAVKDGVGDKEGAPAGDQQDGVNVEAEASKDVKEGEAWEEASRKAIEAQPTGYTLATTQVKTPVPFLLKATLREYQHIGLDWLVALYKKKLNGILADEMGLGKTIQAISLLAWLACEEGSWGPHLIVVPTSVMLNWEMEFKKFCPAFKLLTYFGNTKERKAKRQGWSKPNAFHICITSYTLVLQDAKMFRRKKWKYLILDEAHMIKNWKSQRWQTLLKFNSKRRLLITGTPLQNDLMELWSLMHFLMPHVFASHAQFKDWFCNPLTQAVEGQGDVNKQLVDRLHSVLRPFLLRRLKADVEKQMPSKHEHVVYCRLSKRQRTLYEDYMSSTETQGTLASGNYMGIISVLMQLRKVCNHPDLFEGRPIVSPLDMPPLELYVPSCILTANQPDMRHHIDISAHGLIPAALPPLASWDAHHISTQATPSDVILDMGVNLPVEFLANCTHPVVAAAAGLRLQGAAGDVFGGGSPRLSGAGGMFNSIQSQPPPSSAVTEASMRFLGALLTEHLAAWQVWRREVVGFMVGLNAVRCGVRPLWSRNLVDMLANICRGPVPSCPALVWSNPHRLRDCPSILLELNCTYEERADSVKRLLEEFVFAIPKARAPIAVCWCSHPDWSTVHNAARQAAVLNSEWYARNASLRTARVRQSMFFPDRKLIQFDCGKLQELAVLLRTLHRGGHRCLIFTQMARMLDILEAFLNIHGYVYMRLDGSTKPEQRQILMQRFNTDTKYFVFILSTRSGGVGINLTGADTVIFYDSDWNPAMDAQAQDRCHRIGQTREVHIYRLVCSKTIEENILKKSDQKRQLDWLAIQSGGFTTDVLSKVNPKDLMAAAAPGGPSADEIQAAMRTVEDEADATAAEVAKQEEAAELEEFTQEPIAGVADGEGEEGARDDEDAVAASGGEGQGGSEARASSDWLGGSPASDAVAVMERAENMEAEAASMGGVVGMESRIQQLEAALRPVEKYAVRIVEELNPVDIEAAVNKAVEALNPLDFSLEELEKRKQMQEEEVDDDEELAVVMDWDKEAGQEAYQRYAEMVQQQLKEEEERGALQQLVVVTKPPPRKPKGQRARAKERPQPVKVERDDSSTQDEVTEGATDGDDTAPTSGTTEAEDGGDTEPDEPLCSPNIRCMAGRRARDRRKRRKRPSAALLSKAPIFSSPSAVSSPTSAATTGQPFPSTALQDALAELKGLQGEGSDTEPELPLAKRRRLREQVWQGKVKAEQGSGEESATSVAGAWRPAEQLWHPWPSAWDVPLAEAVQQLLQVPGSCPPPPQLWMQVPKLLAERVSVAAEEWVSLTPGNCQLRFLTLLRAWAANTSSDATQSQTPTEQLDSIRQRLAQLQPAINSQRLREWSRERLQDGEAAARDGTILQRVQEELDRLQSGSGARGVEVAPRLDTQPLAELTVRMATRLTNVLTRAYRAMATARKNASKGARSNSNSRTNSDYASGADDSDTSQDDHHHPNGPHEVEHKPPGPGPTAAVGFTNLATFAGSPQIASSHSVLMNNASAHAAPTASPLRPSNPQPKARSTGRTAAASPPAGNRAGTVSSSQPGYFPGALDQGRPAPPVTVSGANASPQAAAHGHPSHSTLPNGYRPQESRYTSAQRAPLSAQLRRASTSGAPTPAANLSNPSRPAPPHAHPTSQDGAAPTATPPPTQTHMNHMNQMNQMAVGAIRSLSSHAPSTYITPQHQQQIGNTQQGLPQASQSQPNAWQQAQPRAVTSGSVLGAMYLASTGQPGGSLRVPTSMTQLPTGAVVYHQAVQSGSQQPVMYHQAVQSGSEQPVQILGNLQHISNRPAGPTGYAQETSFIPVVINSQTGHTASFLSAIPTSHSTSHATATRQASSMADRRSDPALRYADPGAGAQPPSLLNTTSSARHTTTGVVSQDQFQALQQIAMQQASSRQDPRGGRGLPAGSVSVQLPQGSAQVQQMGPQFISYQSHPHFLGLVGQNGPAAHSAAPGSHAVAAGQHSYVVHTGAPLGLVTEGAVRQQQQGPVSAGMPQPSLDSSRADQSRGQSGR